MMLEDKSIIARYIYLSSLWHFFVLSGSFIQPFISQLVYNMLHVPLKISPFWESQSMILSAFALLEISSIFPVEYLYADNIVVNKPAYTTHSERDSEGISLISTPTLSNIYSTIIPTHIEGKRIWYSWGLRSLFQIFFIFSERVDFIKIFLTYLLILIIKNIKKSIIYLQLRQLYDILYLYRYYK